MSGFSNSVKRCRNKAFVLFFAGLLLIPKFSSQALDYSNQDRWLVLPEKVPNFFQNKPMDSSWIAKVDVFYVYPTFLLEEDDPRWNAPAKDEKLQEEILQKAVKFQASAWLECGRLFVPYYRQAHLRAYDSIKGRGREALLFAYEDVAASFRYYLEHYNHGKPIILAGHSQGSTHLTLLLKEFFDGKPLSKQLIAAYLPGVGIDSNEFKQLEFMTKPSTYGGFVSWNTMYETPDTYRYPYWYHNRYCINPLSWDLSPVTSKSAHQGFLYSNGKIYRRCFDATLCQGAVCLTHAKWPINWLAKRYQSLHVGDVNLFWKDIGINSKARINAFFLNELQH
jgi:hypothetical protein